MHRRIIELSAVKATHMSKSSPEWCGMSKDLWLESVRVATEDEGEGYDGLQYGEMKDLGTEDSCFTIGMYDLYKCSHIVCRRQSLI